MLSKTDLLAPRSGDGLAFSPRAELPSRMGTGRRDDARPAPGCRATTTGVGKDPPLMTYCLGIVTKYGLVMASDSRTNAGYDQVNVCRKMYTFVTPGEQVFVILASGSLSLTQSITTLLRRDFDAGKGLARAGSLYDAARVIGDQTRKVDAID